MFEEAAIRYKGSVQLAVVDHITSSSAIVLPIRKIADKLRPLGVLVVVDGAHAPGQGTNFDKISRIVHFVFQCKIISCNKYKFDLTSNHILYLNCRIKT